jgi:Holliday junction resolvasome RuvABC endonuclease subunit
MRSLGIDPGVSKGSAWALYDSDDDSLRVGTLKLTDDKDLWQYFSLVIDLIHETRADVVGIETQYAPRLPANEVNRLSREDAMGRLYAIAAAALKLAYIRGLFVGAALTCQCSIAQVHPTTVKQAITGNGRASKEQVKAMVEALFGKRLGEDRADAAAIAIAAVRRAAPSR